MEDDEDAREVMWAPHRRPAFPVDAPALICHLMISVEDEWTPYLARSKTQARARRDELVRALNGYLDRLQPADAPFKPRFVVGDPSSPPGYTRSAGGKRPKRDPQKVELTDTLFFRMTVENSVRLGVRIDVHNEYLTMTFIADRLTLKPGTTAGGRIREILANLAAGDSNLETASKQVEQIYDAFWDEWLPRELGAGADDMPKDKLRDFKGKRIAEIRGFVACEPGFNGQMSSRLRPKLDLEVTDRRDRKVDPLVFKFVQEHPNFFGTVLGLNDNDATEMKSPTNVPISGVLDGAAIYGSTLRGKEDHDIAPMRYFIIYNGGSQSQFGRLIRRLNVLGELRIAALLDMKALRVANQAIRDLGYHVDEQLHKAAGTVDLADIDLRYDKADRGTPIEPDPDPLPVCRGGAIYRIGRSEYYATAYKERLRDMRIVRIEGWQPYDAFMRRNLFMEFDYVSQIGDRFTAVREQIQRLRQREVVSQSIRSSRLTSEATTATRQATHELVRLQAFGEIVSAMAFTYYGAHVAHAFDDLHAWWWLPFASTGTPQEPGAGLYALTFGFYLLLRIAAQILLGRRIKK